MDRLVRQARELCKMDLYGGRVQVVGTSGLVLYDVAHVPHELLDVFRGAKVDIVSESTSLSGFVVRIALRQDKTMRVLAAWTVLAWLFYLMSTRIQGVVI